MARSFVTTPIVDPVKAPISKRSLTHINAAWDELGEDIVKAMLGSYTTNDVIILYGCAVTANIPGTSSVTAGAIYYNGRIYKVDANASISSPSNTLVWSIDPSYIAGDPATFSDGSTANFHKIEKFKLSNGTSGSGIADYDASTVKSIDRKQNIAASVDAYINGRSVIVNYTYQPSSTTAGTTIFTIPSSLRTAVNKSGFYIAACYQGGGGASQYNLTTIIEVNTNTGVVKLSQSMPPGTDNVTGQFMYLLD